MTDRVFDAEMVDLIERYYLVSWYADVDRVPAERVVSSKGIVPAEGHELVACMRANVDEAIFNRDGIKARYERAQRDGLFDMKRVEDVSAETQEKWLAAVEMMKGDRARCIAELKHWREYTQWAMDKARTAVDPRLPREAAE